MQEILSLLVKVTLKNENKSLFEKKNVQTKKERYNIIYLFSWKCSVSDGEPQQQSLHKHRTHNHVRH